MNTVTLKVTDDYFNDFIEYLNKMPENQIVIEKISNSNKKSKKLEIQEIQEIKTEANEIIEVNEKVKINTPSVLIRLKKLSQEHHKKLPEIELFDSNFHSWQINIENIKKVKYAFSIYQNIIKEVFLVFNWKLSDDKLKYEMIGTLADNSVRKRYIGKSVENYFPFGTSNPIRILNV
jgi:hypothetical protein